MNFQASLIPHLSCRRLIHRKILKLDMKPNPWSNLCPPATPGHRIADHNHIMSRNSFDIRPRRGAIILVRHGQRGTTQNQPQVLLVWDAPEARHAATPYNVRVIDANLLVPYRGRNGIIDEDLRRQIRDANTPDDALVIFLHRVESLGLYDDRNEFLDTHAYPFAGFLGPGSTFFFRPCTDVVRFVLLGDICDNPHCREGMVAANHREEMYRRYALHQRLPEPWHGDRHDVPLPCPECLPWGIVHDSENLALLTLALDTGASWSNQILEVARTHERRLNDIRLQLGYGELTACPQVVWHVDQDHSGWISRRPGRWAEGSDMLRQTERIVAMSNGHIRARRSFNQDTEASSSQQNSAADTTNTAVTKTNAQLQEAVGETECCICLEAVGDGENTATLRCTHCFHLACITTWLERHSRCPMCRRTVSP